MRKQPLLRMSYCACWVILYLTALSLALVQVKNSNIAALLGAVAIHIAGVLAYGWYGLLDLHLRQTRIEDIQQLEEIEAWRKEIPWLPRLMFFVFPGLWIGVTARSPLPMTLLYTLFFVVVRQVAYAADRILDPKTQSRSPLKSENHLLDMALLLIGAVLGVVIRGLFYP